MAQEMGLGCVEKSLRLPGQFRGRRRNPLPLSGRHALLAWRNKPIDFMHLTRESHARLAAALAELIPTLF